MEARSVEIVCRVRVMVITSFACTSVDRRRKSRRAPTLTRALRRRFAAAGWAGSVGDARGAAEQDQLVADPFVDVVGDEVGAAAEAVAALAAQAHDALPIDDAGREDVDVAAVAGALERAAAHGERSALAARRADREEPRAE